MILAPGTMVTLSELARVLGSEHDLHERPFSSLIEEERHQNRSVGKFCEGSYGTVITSTDGGMQYYIISCGRMGWIAAAFLKEITNEIVSR